MMSASVIKIRPRQLFPLPSKTARRSFWSRKSPPPPQDLSYSVVSPGTVSPQLAGRCVPAQVTPPEYFLTGVPPPSPAQPTVNTAEEIERLRAACSLARRILRDASSLATPGVTTDQIDQLVTRLAFEAGAYPSPLNYRNFPKSVCTSVNNVICHGIPDDRPLLSGDIINIDVTVFLGGFHGDCSDTFLVGEVDEAGRTLVEVARAALAVGVEQCGPGQRFSSIGESIPHSNLRSTNSLSPGAAIQDYVTEQRLAVVPAFTGHGIGRHFHGPPDIYPCRNSYPGTGPDISAN